MRQFVTHLAWLAGRLGTIATVLAVGLLLAGCPGGEGGGGGY